MGNNGPGVPLLPIIDLPYLQMNSSSSALIVAKRGGTVTDLLEETFISRGKDSDC